MSLRKSTVGKVAIALSIPVRTLFFAVSWTAVLGIAIPAMERALYLSALVTMHAPAAVQPPITGITPSALRDTWHAPRPGGRRHEGIDIFSPRGTPVRATTEGIVLRRGSTRLGGNAVWILGPAGQRHYYAHLDRFAALAVGERVQPGTIVGYVGNTGNAKTTPPHLHYGIYAKTGALNPFGLLARGTATDAARTCRRMATGTANAGQDTARFCSSVIVQK